MKGWNVGDKVRDFNGNVGTITGLDSLGAWIMVRGHVHCVGWSNRKGGMPDRETYDREWSARETPLLAKGGV